MTHSSLLIQITPESTPSTPPWLGEVVVVAQVLKRPEWTEFLIGELYIHR